MKPNKVYEVMVLNEPDKMKKKRIKIYALTIGTFAEHNKSVCFL